MANNGGKPDSHDLSAGAIVVLVVALMMCGGILWTIYSVISLLVK